MDPYCCLKFDGVYYSIELRPEPDTHAFEEKFLQNQIALLDLQDELQGFFYLPSKRHVNARLIFLSRIQEGSGFCPFTQMQEKTFRISEKTDSVATNCLKFGCGLLICSSLIGGATGGPAYTAGKWIIETVSLSCATISNFFSYCSTGWVPHIASERANEKQNLFHEAEAMYCELGIRLMELDEQHPEFAKELAEGLNIPEISSAMQESLCEHEAQILLTPLKAAKKYVLQNEFPSHPPVLRLKAENIRIFNELAEMKMALEKMEQSYHSQGLSISKSA